ncbi:MAG: magnesium transporter [Archangium sp.]|nr:magnesium transporter [Archangium sp.]
MTTALVGESASTALARAREKGAPGGSIFVIDVEGKLVGSASIVRLLAEPNATVEACIDARTTTLPSDTDQERIALHAVRHKLTAVPLHDQHGRFVGVVAADALLSIQHREHVEDLHRLAGISREEHQARGALSEPPLRRARHRLPWLIVGLGGSILSAWVMSRFERTLAEQVSVAFFIPAVVYLADAIGTQTEAIAVRFLSLSHVPFRSVLWGEVRTGFLMGLALGVLALPIVAVAFELRLALAVGFAIMVAGTVATAVGLLFPWALARFGKDPAFGSGPLATIVQDVLSLLVYFASATVLLR